MLHSRDPAVIVDACRALSDDSIFDDSIIDAGVCSRLVELMMHTSEEVATAALRAVRNIVSSLNYVQIQVLWNCNVLPYLEQFLSSSKEDVRIGACQTLIDIAEVYEEEVQIEPCLPVISSVILYSSDPAVLEDACMALSKIANPYNDLIVNMIDAGVCSKLVELLMHTSEEVATAAWRAVNGIVLTGADVQIQDILNCNALQYLEKFLSSPEEDVRIGACQALIYIAAVYDKEVQIQPCLPVISRLILYSSDPAVLVDACLALSEIANGPVGELMVPMIDAGVCSKLVELLMHTIEEVVRAALYAINRIVCNGADVQIQVLLNCNALQYLEKFLSSPDEDVRTIAYEAMLEMKHRHRLFKAKY